MSTKPRILDERYAFPGEYRDGGMARVFKATDLEQSSKIVAVKILKQGTLDERIESLVFERETKALQRLNHPNIVALLDAGRARDTNERYMVLNGWSAT